MPDLLWVEHFKVRS